MEETAADWGELKSQGRVKHISAQVNGFRERCIAIKRLNEIQVYVFITTILINFYFISTYFGKVQA